MIMPNNGIKGDGKKPPRLMPGVMSSNNYMKKLILTFIILIGAYTILRNNVFKFPDQIMWITNPNFLFKVFLPFFMVISATLSLFMVNKKAYFTCAAGGMAIDAIYRLAISANHLYEYIKYRDIYPPQLTPGAIRVVTNLWPSHIMLSIEVVLIVMCVLLIFEKKPSFIVTSS